MKKVDRVFNYTIIVEGHVSGLWLHGLQDFVLKKLPSGNTRLSLIAKDDSAFYGMLTILRDMGLSIIRIERNPFQSEHKKTSQINKRTL
jgi:hypothetical protein